MWGILTQQTQSMINKLKNELIKLYDTAKEKAREYIVKGIFLLLFVYGVLIRDYIWHLLKATLTTPIISWHIEEAILLIICITIVFAFIFLLAKQLKRKPKEPTTTLQHINQAITQISKPEKPVQYEHFHTFDGITFKYNSGNGQLFQSPYCSYHHVKMEDLFDPLLNSRGLTRFKCPICKEAVSIRDYDFKNIKESFASILDAFVKGHLPELPSKSEP